MVPSVREGGAEGSLSLDCGDLGFYHPVDDVASTMRCDSTEFIRGQLYVRWLRDVKRALVKRRVSSRPRLLSSLPRSAFFVSASLSLFRLCLGRPISSTSLSDCLAPVLPPVSSLSRSLSVAEAASRRTVDRFWLLTISQTGRASTQASPPND